MKKVVFAVILSAVMTATAELGITSFCGNGTLVWTNSEPVSICHVEWASDLTSGWHRSWADLTDILMTNGTGAAKVPMFYRVVYNTTGVMEEGLALYLPLNGNTSDASTNGTDGVNSGAVLTSDRNGNLNNAYSFDGSGTQIYVPDTPSLDVTNLTVSFWYKPSATASISELVNKFGGDGNISFGSELRPDGTVSFRISSGGTLATLMDITSTTTVTAANWYHVSGTYSGSEMRLYINGVLERSVAKFGAIFNSSESLRIGRYGYYSHPCYGTIDEVAIWNRALSESEIKLLYLNGGKL